MKAPRPGSRPLTGGSVGPISSSLGASCFQELPITFGPCAISQLDEYTMAGTGCTLRINSSHVGSLVNGDTTTGWETTNNYVAVVDTSKDARLVKWTQISHGIEGNHSAGERGWIGTPGNHIPPPFGLIGNVVAYHNSSAREAPMVAVVSRSVGDPRASTSCALPPGHRHVVIQSSFRCDSQ